MGGMLLPEVTTMILLSWKLGLPPGHFGLLMPLNQQAKKEVAVLAMTGVTDPDYQGETGLLLCKGFKEEYIQMQKLLWGTSYYSHVLRLSQWKITITQYK